MTPEEKKLLEKTADLAEENNKILRGMRRNSRLSGAFHIVYWLVILGVSYGAYIYVKPYSDQLLKITGGIKGSLDQIEKINSQLKTFGR